MTERRILLIDGDAATRQALAEQLRLQAGLVILEAADGQGGLELARREACDAVVVDAQLPDGEGVALCRRLRSEGVACPILLLTSGPGSGGPGSGGTPGDDPGGASERVAKPFRLEVLLARLRAVLRQHQAGDEGESGLGPYLFRPAAKLLVERATGRKLRLTEKETAILLRLLRAGEEPVGRERLLDEVWGYNAGVTTHTLETHIYRLRRKIEPDPARPRLLLTEAGGYRLAP